MRSERWQSHACSFVTHRYFPNLAGVHAKALRASRKGAQHIEGGQIVVIGGPNVGQRLQGRYADWDKYRILEKAAKTAVEAASHSLRELRIAEVIKQDMVVTDGKVEAYRTKVRLSFKYENNQ